MTKSVYWCGRVPERCEISKEPMGSVMYDCRLPKWGWANINERTFKEYGCKTGTGFGQKYARQNDGRWLKVGGGNMVHQVPQDHFDKQFTDSLNGKQAACRHAVFLLNENYRIKAEYKKKLEHIFARLVEVPGVSLALDITEALEFLNGE